MLPTLGCRTRSPAARTSPTARPCARAPPRPGRARAAARRAVVPRTPRCAPAPCTCWATPSPWWSPPPRSPPTRRSPGTTPAPLRGRRALLRRGQGAGGGRHAHGPRLPGEAPRPLSPGQLRRRGPLPALLDPPRRGPARRGDRGPHPHRGAPRPGLHARVAPARPLLARREAQSLGRAEESLALLEQVASEGASTWYGVLARSRLAQAAPERARAVSEKLIAPRPPRRSGPWTRAGSSRTRTSSPGWNSCGWGTATPGRS